jgi:serine protease AprX
MSKASSAHDAEVHSRNVPWRTRNVVDARSRWSRRLVAAILATLLGVASAAPAGALLGLNPPPPPPPVNLIVQQWNVADTTVRDYVRFLGGTVTWSLPIVGGFAATVPEGAVTTLAGYAGVRAVTFDTTVQPQDLPADGGAPSVHREAVGTPTDPAAPAGEGVTVAVIDTGISAVPDLADNLRPVLNSAGVAVSCVNFSKESGCGDSYGHGTFVAGLIAGNGVRKGIAPAADLLSVKLSGRDGTSTVSQLLAAIQWVVENKDAYDIGVLNLSLKVSSNLSYRIDPVNFAVEQAWASGIVVVVSAGNQGAGAETIAKPADDPWVISVGSTDDQGSAPITDDLVSSFSSRGPTYADKVVKPDVVAPGRSLVSLRAPGSAADLEHPTYVDGTYRRGTGTSFSAPIVAGAAAVLQSADPTATNDRIKFALMSTARPLAGIPATDQGAGVVDVSAALAAPPGEANAALFHPLLFPTAVPSVADVTGSVWEDVVWTGGNWQGGNWQGGNWQGGNWQGGNWQSQFWS